MSVGDIVGTGKALLGYGSVARQPGVGGGHIYQDGKGGYVDDNGAPVTKNADGTYTSASTGTTFTAPDPNNNGSGSVVAAPNLAQQGAFQQQVQQGDLTNQQTAQGNYQSTVGAGNKLLGSLSNTITNPNAPSVAATQLTQTTGANDRTQLASAAGVGGANAFAARRAAMSTIGATDQAAAGQAAALRAQEVAAAQAQSGSVIGNMATAANTNEATNATAAGAAANTEAKTQGQVDSDQVGANNKDNDTNNALGKAFVGGASKVLGSLF
jgi:hypothetical protein